MTRALDVVAAVALLTAFGPAAAAAVESCGPVYRLYRTHPPELEMPGRMHVATFDSCVAGTPGGDLSYNAGNCEIARRLFQSQPGVIVTYWCERVSRAECRP